MLGASAANVTKLRFICDSEYSETAQLVRLIRIRNTGWIPNGF